MFTFNNTHLFTGYLKQLLSSVAIPTIRVIPTDTDGTYNFKESHIIKTIPYPDSCDFTIPYIKDSKIQCLKDDGWHTLIPDATTLLSGQDLLGYTQTLTDPGIYYSTETHEYLGDFLRFLRDAYGLNLMSLYNCFNKRYSKKLNFSFTLDTGDKINFSSTDKNYKIYMIPVKLFQKYTIATDCPEGLELCCGFYSSGTDTSKINASLHKQTHVKLNQTFFNQPILYTKLYDSAWLQDNGNNRNLFTKSFKEREGLNSTENNITRWDIAKKEHDLYLFLKMPINHTKTITILEGDYLDYNKITIKNKVSANAATKSIVHSLEKVNNHEIINFENTNFEFFAQQVFKPISQLQLLAINSADSYPFADRLVEYLLGNVITHLDAIEDNVLRLQQIQKDEHYSPALKGFWESNTRLRIYDFFMNNSQPTNSISGQATDIPGRYTLINGNLQNNTVLFDLLGYADKDVEQYYASFGKDKRAKELLRSVDLYNNIYKN